MGMIVAIIERRGNGLQAGKTEQSILQVEDDEVIFAVLGVHVGVAPVHSMRRLTGSRQSDPRTSLRWIIQPHCPTNCTLIFTSIPEVTPPLRDKQTA
ncbi:hypothetical protein C6366_03310 [Desulfonatronum sp. SC1]|nr:hypothetical protein C6366_03310 [Desulfonatronum sp. SC1]